MQLKVPCPSNYYELDLHAIKALQLFVHSIDMTETLLHSMQIWVKEDRLLKGGNEKPLTTSSANKRLSIIVMAIRSDSDFN